MWEIVIASFVVDETFGERPTHAGHYVITAAGMRFKQAKV
jgi:hypothetical protein